MLKRCVKIVDTIDSYEPHHHKYVHVFAKKLSCRYLFRASIRPLDVYMH